MQASHLVAPNVASMLVKYVSDPVIVVMFYTFNPTAK
jgi:hypothetical protein